MAGGGAEYLGMLSLAEGGGERLGMDSFGWDFGTGSCVLGCELCVGSLDVCLGMVSEVEGGDWCFGIVSFGCDFVDSALDIGFVAGSTEALGCDF